MRAKTSNYYWMLLEKRKFSYLIFIPVLVIQNLAIFWNHYFYKMGFPWDFSATYYSIPAFWTTAVSQGIIPQWIPFQSMGYPLFLNAQSGFYYPFFWLFSILSIQYTLDAAVIFQVIHVLFGSIGMFFFLKFMFKSSRYALVGAIAFQFFGGFFSNAEHADIVRAFAISPWLFYVFTLNLERPALSRKVLFIPIVLYVLATGAYPGNYISSIFIMSLFVGLQGINGFVRGIGKRKSVVIVVVMISLMILGLGISMVHLGPFLQFGDELTRFSPESSIVSYNLLKVEHFPGFFMSNSPIPGEISMSSTFLTLPIIIFASFLPVSSIKKYWIFFVMLIVAILMAVGNQTFFWNAMTSLVPELEFSRFSVSDYRIFIAIPLMIFGIAGLKAVVEGKFTLKTFFLRIGFILSWFALGISLLFTNSSKAKWLNLDLLNQQVILAIIILGITLFVLGCFVIKFRKNKLKSIKKSIGLSLIALIFFGALIIVDGFRVTSDMVTWNMYPIDNIYTIIKLPLQHDGKLITYSIFENLPDQRPERKMPTNWSVKGTGYLTGDFMMQDYGGTKFNSRNIVESNNNYKNFMQMNWNYLLLEPVPNFEGSTKINLPEKVFSNLNSNKEKSSIVQTYYGINDIIYQVSLQDEKLMVENEIYFPGWEAELKYSNFSTFIEAHSVNDVFRAWQLPAGDYVMTAHFEFPNNGIYQSSSVISLLIWISLLIVFWKRLEIV